MERPRPISGHDAGRGRVGGWIAPDGRFYPAPWLHHLRVSAALRATGDGPTEPWDMRDGWAMVRADGEVVVLPYQLTQPQLDTLGDMMMAAPASPYRSHIVASLRQLREVETCR